MARARTTSEPKRAPQVDRQADRAHELPGLKPLLASIGANVRALRTRRKLTQEQLAERADLDLRFVQRVEYGQTNLSVAVLVALADTLGVKPEDLFAPARLPAARRGRPPGT